MIITDKNEMKSLFDGEVLGQRNVISLEEEDYRECQKVGEENFAIRVCGRNLLDAFNNLKAELPNRSAEFISALILYIQGNEIMMDEMDVVNDFMDELPDGVIARWGLGETDPGTGVKLMMFAFV